ncbi:4-hydroxybutyrate dehydrogenase [Enterococcus gilvus]|uniref:4-hydroxybutyrate dehydrogenase n=1 Tax=Enterococcus gilvus TaxID=160453 RepID=UPI001C8CAD60|nr:4-hydroxybutyrate dehydrogenase [Enterococcus gilvus]MBX8935468.1 4-hydroxybutyrate dehydrogenase [Enterococcus gilvus]
MEEIIFEPRIYQYETCAEFVEHVSPAATDFILTNQYIYEPFFKDFKLPATVVYQEQYGQGEPTDEMVSKLMTEIRKGDYQRVIAIGGGTILDIAKILSVTDDRTLDEMYDQKDSIKRQRDLLAIPTTCGTGSEVTNIAVVNRLSLGTKMGLVSPEMFPTDAILIPELLTTLPEYVFATSSIDALVHAAESAVSPKATEFTKLFSYAAIRKIITGYQKIEAEGKEVLPSLMKEFLTASTFAGLAFGTAGCGPVHAMSYPFGGTYHVAHGESNFVIFTGVFKHYAEQKNEGALIELNSVLAELLDCPIEEVYPALDQLLDKMLPKRALKDYDVKQIELPQFAKNVIQEQQRLLGNSFIPLDEAQVLKIYQSIY